MTTYKVKLTKDAQQDMRALHDYIADVLQAPETADHQRSRLADAILKLDILPERHPLVSFEPERTQGIRRMTVDNYSVFYRIAGDEVIVIDVFYSASDCVRRFHSS